MKQQTTTQKHARRSQERQVRPIVTCGYCCGQGKRPLRDDLWDTLCMLREMGSSTAYQMMEALKWKGSASAMNNRLEDLRSVALVTRARQGKFWIYRPNTERSGGTSDAAQG